MTDDPETLAKQRYMVLNLVRLFGLALVLGGIAITQGAIDLPAPIGWVIAIAGVVEFFFLPTVLVKSWKSPGQ